MNDFHCYLIVVCGNRIQLWTCQYKVFYCCSGFGVSIFRMEPDHSLRVVGDPVFGKCPCITLMSVDSLYIIRLENPNDFFVPHLDQVIDSPVLAKFIVQHNLRLILQLLICPVYENVGYVMFVQCFIIFKVV